MTGIVTSLTVSWSLGLLDLRGLTFFVRNGCDTGTCAQIFPRKNTRKKPPVCFLGLAIFAKVYLVDNVHALGMQAVSSRGYGAQAVAHLYLVCFIERGLLSEEFHRWIIICLSVPTDRIGRQLATITT